MSFAATPATAAWSHRDARSGFEVVFFQRLGTGRQIDGCTTAVEDGQTWFVDYAITLDADWITRAARVISRSASGRRSVRLEADGAGHWLVDGEAAPHLDGCLDVDLESSATTNALPVHRMALPAGAGPPRRRPTSALMTPPSNAWNRNTCAPPTRARTSATTTPHPHSSSPAAWSTTSPASS